MLFHFIAKIFVDYHMQGKGNRPKRMKHNVEILNRKKIFCIQKEIKIEILNVN